MSDSKSQQPGYFTKIFEHMSPTNYVTSLIRKRVVRPIEDLTPKTPVSTGVGEMLPKRQNTISRMFSGELPSLTSVMDLLGFVDDVRHYRKTGGDKYWAEDAQAIAKSKTFQSVKQLDLSGVIENGKQYFTSTVVKWTVTPELKQEVLDKSKQCAKQHMVQLLSAAAAGMMFSQMLKYVSTLPKQQMLQFGLRGLAKAWLPLTGVQVLFSLSDMGLKTRDSQVIAFREVMEHHSKTRAPKPEPTELPPYNNSI